METVERWEVRRGAVVVTGAKVRGLEEGVAVGVVEATGGVKTDLFVTKGGVDTSAGDGDLSSLTLSTVGAILVVAV